MPTDHTISDAVAERWAEHAEHAPPERGEGMFIIEIEGDTLTEFLNFFERAVKGEPHGVYMIRISLDGDRIKAKVNERMWTPSLGKVTVIE